MNPHLIYGVIIGLTAVSCNSPRSTASSDADSVTLTEERIITNPDTPAAKPPLPTTSTTEPLARKTPDQPIPLPLVPRFPDGDEAMFAFIERNMKYPDAAINARISGTVLVGFKVKSSGELTNFKVLKAIGYGCDEEAVRIVKLMPKWIPSKTGNKPVDMDFSIPVNFVIK